MIIGADASDESLGLIGAIPPEVRSRLTEPGTIVVDESDLENLGLRHGTGEEGEINQRRVRIVGTVTGFRGHNFIFIFCSLQTARLLLPMFGQNQDLTMCVLARCRQPGQADAVVNRLRERYPDMGVYNSKELSLKVRLYWLFRSSGGTVLVCTVGLALLVGLVVTSQTLSAAVLAALREYAVLDALGISRRRLSGLVLAQSFWIGAGGLLLAVPITCGLSWGATLLRTRILLPPALVLLTVVLTLIMALLSGMTALRPLRHVEPANLLR
jgi:putative ABC transport system permease protein